MVGGGWDEFKPLSVTPISRHRRIISFGTKSISFGTGIQSSVSVTTAMPLVSKVIIVRVFENQITIHTLFMTLNHGSELIKQNRC